MNRFVCIHGHFYQPPRENPWWEDIEFQDSAYPYHDWNRRITSECYGPNTAARILGPDRKIIDIVNNYSRISFNFGPTLLSWMKGHEPEVYKAIITADKISQHRYSGHGSAIAQVYNHMIMPLANSRDKRTQIIWGIKDFEHRFSRRPEGMWLAETAVDLETLDILSECGIKFTILAPRQAKRVKGFDDKKWRSVEGGEIDSRMPYLCRLPSGRSIAIFFYDGPVSNDIAFGGLLNSGESFANRLVSVFQKTDQPQLVHVATDGESYGHHHIYGDMALSYCIYYIESNNLARVTVYGEFLEKFPPTQEVEIFENSSWSCVHGVERWKSSCGCRLGSQANWQQDWRAPLRKAMDWLRDNLINIFEQQIAELVSDPWLARDNYIDVVVERSQQRIDEFISRHAKRELSHAEKVKVLKLLEMQRQAMLMYTSCGWFFDDISGIETIQIIQYAARALNLAQEVSGADLEKDYKQLLEQAPSNIKETKDGGQLFAMHVKPSTVEAVRVGVHYAVTSLFNDYHESSHVHAYTITKKSFERNEADRNKLVFGQISVRSDITMEEESVCFVALYMGDHEIVVGADKYSESQPWDNIFQEIKGNFLKADEEKTTRLVDKYFKDHRYSLRYLFKDEQRQVLREIFKQSENAIELAFRMIYAEYSPILKAVESVRIPVPNYLALVIDFIFDTDIRRAMESEEPNFAELDRLIKESKRWPVRLDKTNLSFIASRQINKFMKHWSKDIDDIALLDKIIKFFKVTDELALNLRIFKAQNIYFTIGKEHLHAKLYKSSQADDLAIKWLKYFYQLSDCLKVKIE